MFLKYAENANRVRVNMIYNSYFRFGIHLCFVVSPFKKKSTLLHPDDVLYIHCKKIISIFPAGDGKLDNLFLLRNVLLGADIGER
jgi:hypothetical protein